MYNRNGQYDARPFDRFYPRQTKSNDDPQRMGSDELMPLNVDGQVELIARSSYRLGTAESNVSNLFNELRETRERAEKAEAELATAKEKRDTYESWYRQTRADKEALETEVTKLKARLAPKKKVAKKGKK
jgi:hypothetical protein